MTEAANQVVADKLRSHPPKRILVRCREHLGDIVNSTGQLRAIRNHWPTASVTVEVGEGTENILEGSPLLDELWIRGRHEGFSGRLRSLRRMRSGQFDLMIMLDDSRRLIIEGFAVGIPIRVGCHRGKGQWAYSAGTFHRGEIHEVRDNFAEMLGVIGVREDARTPALSPLPAHYAEAERAFREASLATSPAIGIHIAAAHDRRTIPVETLLSLVTELGQKRIQPVLVGGPGDADTAQEIAKHVNVVNLVGRLSPLGTAAAMERLSAFIGGDSGPMHVAAAMGIPVIALYTSISRPEFTKPFGDANQFLHRDQMSDYSARDILEVVARMSAPQ